MTFIAIAALAVCAAACGSNESGSVPSPAPTQAASPGQSASPSPKKLSFKLNPVGTATATGTITVTAGQRSTTIELNIKGLQPNSSHVSHIHTGGCPPSARGVIVFALNQVVADGQGTADTKTTLNIAYPPASGRWYVVVHSGPDMQGSSSAYLMCGELF